MESQTRSEILLVGTDSDMESRLRAELRARTYAITTVERGDEALAQALRPGIDVVVSELNTPGPSGLDLLRRLLPLKPNVRVILLDNAPNKETANEATRLGAFQLLSKPFDFAELLHSIRRAVLSTRDVFPALAPGEAEFGRTGLIGTSPLMREIYKQISVAANSQIPVLILGETGTGKELIARAIHRQGPRARQEFVAINCNAIPQSLLEGELLGHEGGAFTGADRKRAGLFERANHGVLFLDEIGELATEIQVKLLRFLQDGRVLRLGATREIQLDVRVVAATNRDLDTAMRQGSFRRDLFYRLNGLPIKPPPLKDHPEDIPDLVRFFLRQSQETEGLPPLWIHRDALEFFQQRSWPGNIRELSNAVHLAVSLGKGGTITLAHAQSACEALKLDPSPRRDTASDLLDRAARGQETKVHAKVMQQTEQSLLRKAMARALGNVTKAAAWLGIKRETLRRKLRRYRILPPF